MPIYEYICEECGQRFEILRGIIYADLPIPCNTCHSNHTHRALSVFYAQSGTKIIAGGSNGGCASCSSTSCSTCGTH